MLGRLGFYKYSDIIPYWDAKERKILINCFLTNKFIDGDALDNLKRELKKIFGVKHVLLTNSGRAALWAGLKSLSFPPKTKIITPSLICEAVLEAITRANLEPYFIDVDDELNVNLKDIKEGAAKGAKAIVLPSYGGKTDGFLEAITLAKKLGLLVIDDAAQSVGTKLNGKFLGSFGDFSILSFGLGKNLTAFGGGVLLTNSEEIYNSAEKLISQKEMPFAILFKVVKHILKLKYRKITRPFFYLLDKFPIFYKIYLKDYVRMSNLDASIILSQLQKMQFIMAKRQRNAKMLASAFANSDISVLTNNGFTKFFALFKNPADNKVFRKNLRKKGVETEGFYFPAHSKPTYTNFRLKKLKISEQIWNRLCILPVGPLLNDKDMQYISKAIVMELKK